MPSNIHNRTHTTILEANTLTLPDAYSLTHEAKTLIQNAKSVANSGTQSCIQLLTE